jgi:hypothetical protein
MSVTLGPMSQSIYDNLVSCNTPDFDTMWVLADALEEEGSDELSHAYRWAAKHGKYPMTRLSRLDAPHDSKESENVYDWDGEGRASRVPEHSKLPIDMFKYMRDMKGKRYGTVHDAFVLLARVLKETAKTT